MQSQRHDGLRRIPFHALWWIVLVECASSPGRVSSGVGDPREPGRPLLWRRSGYRYPVVVLAVD